jgi:hypothetical protein
LRVVADHGQALPVRLHAQQDLRLEGVGVSLMPFWPATLIRRAA